MRWVSQAVEVPGLTTTGTPDSRAGAAFSHRPQLGKLKALMNSASRAWAQHVLRLEQRVLAQALGLAVEQVLALAQALAELGVVGQRVDAAVDVDRRVVSHRAAVGGGDLVIGVAPGLQHLHRLGQQGRARSPGRAAPRRLLAREGEAGAQVQAGGVHAHQLMAQHGVEQRRAGAAAGDPAAAEVVGEAVRWVLMRWLSCG
jgi:hypothetical protein